MDGPGSSNPRGVAVVTGAASGVGLATAKAISDEYAVVGLDLREAPGELDGLSGLDWVQGDIAAQETWDRANSAARERDQAGPESLILCAADLVVATFLETPIEDWERLLRINVLGAIRGLQTFIPQMLERGRGSIAVVCSVNSLYVEEDVSAYSTSKAALLHVVRSAALEYARKGLRINAVCPGAIDTPLLQRHFDALEDPAAAREEVERRHPIGKLLQPEEIANVLRFLVSEEASGMSGAAVLVDGGLTTAYDFDASN